MSASERQVALGLMAPLTGVASIYGADIVRSTQIACAEVNAAGGVLGRPLELLVEDDQSQPAAAVGAARHLVQRRGCAGLIGNLLSNVRIAVADEVSSTLRVPYLNFSFYEGSISDRHFFHFAALPNQQIEPLMDWLTRHQGRRIFFAGHNYEWPRGSIDVARSELDALGGDVRGERYLEFDPDDAQLDALLNEVARSGAEVLMPFLAGRDQIRLLKRFAERGLGQRIQIAACHLDEVMLSHVPTTARGGLLACNSWFMGVEGPLQRRLLEQLAAAPGVDRLWPEGNGIMSHFGEATWICVHAYAEAARLAGSTAAEAICAALPRIRIAAAQGPVWLDPDTRHAYVNIYLARSDAEGRFSIIEKFPTRAPKIPTRHALATRPATDRPTHFAQTKLLVEDAAGILAVADTPIIACAHNGVIRLANAAACELFGYHEGELDELPLERLLPPHLRGPHRGLMARFVESGETRRAMAERREIVGYRRDGSFVPLEVAIARHDSESSQLLVATLRDISTRKRTEDQLRWHADHDALTALPNRRLIRERLSTALRRQHRLGAVGLLLVNLDGFKLINDSYGSAIGNRVLSLVAQRLLELCPAGDTIGRLSGDEFIVLSEDLSSSEQAVQLAEHIITSMSEELLIDDLPLHLTTSVGIALDDADLDQADDLLRAADTAMHEAKLSSAGSCLVYSSMLAERTRQRMQISQGLHRAIAKGELSLRLQPIVNPTNGHIVAAELLLRWHPATGEVPPAVFIPIAEATGTIIGIGDWVFAQACEIEARWRQRWGDAAPAYLAVNLSPRQLNKSSIDGDFAAMIERSGARPERLQLEVTETALMADVEANLSVLRRLAALGMPIAVDDFGTGYSSLAQLTRMPVSVLKVDRAFVASLDQQPENRAVVHAIVSLGRALGLTLVAEGVETPAQLDEMLTQGCSLAQGYLFYRPMELDAFDRAIEQQLCERSTRA
ncbi:EAL domain-containing protein [Pseudomarimonas arenosa]|uniref:EAL domain-containing protein n=1 Tax=Pseudomarimonas arenosa TaxID=2774145 RepID=A0AAW3ZI74_9GAMM|nr:EAL domain-containing protein [Pseudomarimonas arenosa]MBD8524687.1 EAL domain-containing protein [Pseudomarimonas arenosa]